MAILVAALALQFIYPWIAIYVFYGFLFWLVASFFVFRMPAMNRPVSGAAPRPPAPLGPPAAPGAAPAPAGGGLKLSFCAFCGADLPIGAAQCPSCHHEVRRF
ncbi:MAG TPA: hypothetical protein VLY85_03370 [Thermoplasmata archaeon]|nr:hypothetical protein [Thermoplasmata archaeon]